VNPVGSLQLTSSVQRNCTTRPKTVAVQFQTDGSTRRRRVPLDLAGGGSSTLDGAWKTNDDVGDQSLALSPSPSYYDVVVADFTDDEPGVARDRPLSSPSTNQVSEGTGPCPVPPGTGP